MDIEGAASGLIEKLESWVRELILHLPNLAAAVAVVIVAWLVARLVRGGAERALRHFPNRALASLLGTIAYIAVLAVGAFVALGILELDKTVTSLLAGAGILALALGFAFQDIASNFMAGVLISFRQPYRVGDLVESNDYFGVVERIDLRNTVLSAPTGEQVLIPNQMVFGNPLVNFTIRGSRRVDLEVGVSYGDDLATVLEVTRRAIGEVTARDASREPEVLFTGFGESSIDLVARFWIAEVAQGRYLAARSEAILMLKSAFDEAGIDIPFPIRTLDFGIKGGTVLSDELIAAGRR